jgi:hypothetical protein
MKISHHKRFNISKTPGFGQAMIEFVIILPVMLLLVMGIIQFAMIYKAKITLNYATFQTVRAGSLNHTNTSDMNMAFASNMAPLYTTSWVSMDNSTNKCSSNFIASDAGRRNRIGTQQILDNGLRATLDANIDNFGSESVLCARRVVKDQINKGYVKIKQVNPSPESFVDYGVDATVTWEETNTQTVETIIPNDNLMYRDARMIGGGSAGQSIQDANLLKIHVGYCYELIIPFVNRMVWAMQRYGTGTAPASEKKYGRYWADPGSTPPGFFGPPDTEFAKSCIESPTDTGRYSIVLYSQGIMRMQSAAVECYLLGTCPAAY